MIAGRSLSTTSSKKIKLPKNQLAKNDFIKDPSFLSCSKKSETSSMKDPKFKRTNSTNSFFSNSIKSTQFYSGLLL